METKDNTFESEFEARTLDESEVSLVSGGMRAQLGCTGGTQSVCHVDGTVDGDGFSKLMA